MRTVFEQNAEIKQNPKMAERRSSARKSTRLRRSNGQIAKESGKMHLGLTGYAPLPIYLGGIVAFVLSALWKPQIGLYYLVPLIPMQTVRYWVHEYPFGEKLVDVLLVGVVIGLIFQRERPIFVSSPMNKVV